MNPRARQITIKEPYSLIVAFENNEMKEIDLSPYLKYPIYEKLKDKDYFLKAKIQNGIVVWDSETDFDPDRLYLESKNHS